MAAKRVYKTKWDYIGIGASVACTIHCVLLPVLLTSLPLIGYDLLKNSALEIATIMTSLIVGSWALFNGYKKHHHRLWPLLSFVVGIGLVIISNTLDEAGAKEELLKLSGAFCIVTAHGFNLRYCRHCLAATKTAENATDFGKSKHANQ